MSPAATFLDDFRSFLGQGSGRLGLLEVTRIFRYDAQCRDDPFSRVCEEKSLGSGRNVEGRQVTIEVEGLGAVKFVNHESCEFKQRYKVLTHNQMDKLRFD